MLLWEFLATEAESKGIDRDEAMALQWVRSHLPTSQRMLDDQGEHVETIDGFDWEKEWPQWQSNFEALIWLTERRRKRRKATQGDLMPQHVQDAVDKSLRGIRLQLTSHHLGDGVRTWLIRGDGQVATQFHERGWIDDITTLWQAVFLSYFIPDAVVNPSLCRECGRPLPKTKYGKASKSQYCPSCNTKVWRRKNPDAAREMDREQKRKHRNPKPSKRRR